MLGQPPSERLALSRVIRGDLRGARGGAEPAHAMRKPRRAEPKLRILESPAHLAQHGVVPDLAIDKIDLAVASRRQRIHGRNDALDAETGIAGVYQKQGGARLGLR